MHNDLDDIDLRILRILQADARITSSDLAQQVHLSQSPCWKRVKRLEKMGLVSGYHAGLNRRALGWGMMAFVMVEIEKQDDSSSSAFIQAVQAMEEVVMFHGIAGPQDFMLVVVARDLDDYGQLLQRKLHRLPGVRRVSSFLSLEEFKGQLHHMPIPAAAAAPH
ncbi:Lrp/AsnC family transcriptional regulator [Lampropedia aestuarii]|uniref:Lrp/AsnC family transcriptional regulator n=1 Tax=Lampropedia aestuarii TaxID=2562762 RepID=UPI002468D599|nr:Lrp/AsnC family transcriptional regulator [Lampropedia aestuarii]MDH5858638.1 Lrp/AsnC family transcriptional regulator [Lampropedia aestuarii]